MKGGRLYILVLVAVLVLVFLFEYMGPHEFSWRETYDKYDKEPFGSYVFHDVLSSSVDSFSVTNQTFYQIFQNDSMTSASVSPRAFLLTENNPSFTHTDISYMLKLIRAGNRVMICTNHVPHSLELTLNMNTSYENYLPNIRQYIQNKSTRDSIFFGTDTLRPERIYEVYPHLHPTFLRLGVERWVSPEEDTAEDLDTEEIVEKETHRLEFFPLKCDSFQVLSWNAHNKPLVARLFIEKGEFYFVATPLMFTNYGILDGDNASYAFSLLAYLKELPIVRVEAYGKYNDQPRTPLRYILSEPSLRWAVYTTLILLILFMIFTAKRRQRVIPLIKSPPNRSFGFMQLISNLYFQRHDNGEILKMKYAFFCAEVNKLTGIDFQERMPDDSDFQRLAEKTGMNKESLQSSLKNIQLAVYRADIDDTRLKQYIDGMNDILHIMYT